MLYLQIDGIGFRYGSLMRDTVSPYLQSQNIYERILSSSDVLRVAVMPVKAVIEVGNPARLPVAYNVYTRMPPISSPPPALPDRHEQHR